MKDFKVVVRAVSKFNPNILIVEGVKEFTHIKVDSVVQTAIRDNIAKKVVYIRFEDLYDLYRDYHFHDELPDIDYLAEGTVIVDSEYNMYIFCYKGRIKLLLGIRSYDMGEMTLNNLYEALETAVREQIRRRQG